MPGKRPELGAREDGTLTACPNSPNCVISSGSPKKKHRIEPLKANGSQWEKLPQVLEAMPGISVAEHNGNYLRAKATTRVLKFVDDLEFLHRPEEGIIHVRSASRLGYSDFGVNRKRMESIRKQLEQAGA